MSAPHFHELKVKRVSPEAAGAVEFEVKPSLDDAIHAGIQAATHSCPLLITGSIFTAGQARTILDREYNVSPLRF